MRVVAAGLLALMGAVTGIAAVGVHQRWWSLVLVVAAVASVMLALPRGWWARLPYALGFAVVLGFAMTPRGEGDYLIPANGKGYTLLAVGLVLLLAAVASLPRSGART